MKRRILTLKSSPSIQKMAANNEVADFELLQMNVFGVQTYDVEGITECGICKSNLNHVCPDCLESSVNISDVSCGVSLGKCGHVYHYHCISSSRKNSPNCPYDNLTWNFAEIDLGNPSKKLIKRVQKKK